VFDISRPQVIGTVSGLLRLAGGATRELRTRPDLKPRNEITPGRRTDDGLYSRVEGRDGRSDDDLDNDGEMYGTSPGGIRLGAPRFRCRSTGASRAHVVDRHPGGGLGRATVSSQTRYGYFSSGQRNGFASGGDVHEFLLTPEGTAFIILYQAVDWDMTPAGGSMYGAAVDGIVQEIEVETGRVLFEWHALDHIGVEDSYIAIPGQDPDRPSDFVHMNSITIAPDGDLILSMRHTAAV